MVESSIKKKRVYKTQDFGINCTQLQAVQRHFKYLMLHQHNSDDQLLQCYKYWNVRTETRTKITGYTYFIILYNQKDVVSGNITKEKITIKP